MKQTLVIVVTSCLFALAAGFPSSSQELLQPGIRAFLLDAAPAPQRQFIQAEQSLIPLTRQKREQVYFANDYSGQPSYTRGCTSRGCNTGGFREYVSPCRGSGCNGGGFREYNSVVPILCDGAGCGNNGGYREYTTCRGSGCNNGGYRQYTTCRGSGCNGGGFREYVSPCRGSGCSNGGYRDTGSGGCSRGGCTKK